MPCRILIVETHARLSRLLAELLGCKFSQVQVLQAENTESGIALAKEFPLNLVIMADTLPRMNGIEATRWLKRDLPDLPIIILTAYDDAAYYRAAMEAGADSFISKTAIKSELLPAVEKFLKVPEPASNEQLLNAFFAQS